MFCFHVSLIYNCIWSRWKSSIYKLIWKEVLIYIGVYIALSVLYDYVLSDTAKKQVFLTSSQVLPHFRIIAMLID